jgi:hypothetical protein
LSLLYTPCILDCALRFSNKILLLIKKKKNDISIAFQKKKIFKSSFDTLPVYMSFLLLWTELSLLIKKDKSYLSSMFFL